MTALQSDWVFKTYRCWYSNSCIGAVLALNAAAAASAATTGTPLETLAFKVKSL